MKKNKHNTIHFKQSNWLLQYTDLNTKFRTDSNSDFGKDLFKLMSNLIFGKTIHNNNGRTKNKLASSQRFEGIKHIFRLLTNI